MKTELLLKRKTYISYVYLLLAIGFVLITVFPTVYTKELYFIDVEHVSTGFGTGYTDDVPSFSGLALWALAIVYFVHFVYGVEHYPEKYRRVLKGDYVEPNSNESTDHSGWRGIPVSIITMIVIYCSYRYTEIGQEFKNYFRFMCLFWFLLHCLLAYLSSTTSLFKRSSVMVDLNVLQGEKDGDHDYVDIFFDYPAAEDEKVWGKKVAFAYAKLLKEQALLEEQKRIDADKISQESILEIS